MKILFVCKYNRFRSKVAEAIFNKLNKNKKIKTDSAGIIVDELKPYIAKNVAKIMREKGYKIKPKQQQLRQKLVANFDLIIIVADNISPNLDNFTGKIIRWNIPDCSEEDTKKIKQIIKKIEANVKELITKTLNVTTH